MEMTKEKLYELMERLYDSDVEELCEKEELTVIFQFLDPRMKMEKIAVIGDPSGVVYGCLSVLKELFQKDQPKDGLALEIKKMVDAVFEKGTKAAEEKAAAREKAVTFSEMEGGHEE